MASPNIFEKGKWIDPPQLMTGQVIYCKNCKKEVSKTSLRRSHEGHDVEWIKKNG